MIILAGCGALGSRIAIELSTPHIDERWHLYDDDIIEKANIGTSAFRLESVGAPKAIALSSAMYLKAKTIATPYDATIVSSWGLDFDHDTLVIDCLDNAESRAHTIGVADHVLHCGVGEGGTGLVMWEPWYELPQNEPPRGENPICTNQLSHAVLQMTSAVAVGVVLKFLNERVKENYIIQNLEVRKI